jgi:hypothetical protein
METPFPYYRMQASGPSETGYSLVIQIEQGAGGGLDGLPSEADVIAAVRHVFDGDGVNTTLTRCAVESTSL